jgi:hypothetical protein
MAWSPVWRFNARINWVGQPGDYANLIPTTPATVPEAQDFATQWLWTYNNDRPNMAIGGIAPAKKLKMAA